MIKKYNAVKNFDSDVSKSFVKGAAILTISMVIVKVFGLLNKVVLAAILSSYDVPGMTSFGTGLYANAYEIFVVIFTVATGGLPIAVSRLVSENMTKKRYKDVRQIQKLSVPFFTVLGLICTVIIGSACIPYSLGVIHQPYAIVPTLFLAPTVFFGCLASAYRGYYEGQRNMMPTAVSEIIEAVVKLVIGSALAYLILWLGMESNKASHSFLWMQFGNQEEAQKTIFSLSVTGAIMGISLSSMASWLYYFIKFKVQGDGIPRQYYENSIDARQKRETFNMMIRTALPIAGGALVMSLASLIDSAIIQNVLLDLSHRHGPELMDQYGKFYPADAFHGKHVTIHTNLWGCYATALTLMQLVTAVTQAFGSSAMPNVTSAWTKGDKREFRQSMNTVLKMTMMFTLPMSLGLVVLAHPIMGFIYGSSPEIVEIGGNVLTVMGITTIFTAIITPICSMINGIGKVKIPMILYIICLFVKIGTSWIFVSIPYINIQGATVGSMVAYALICVIGMFLLVKYSGVVPDFFNTTIKPLAGAVYSSAAAFFTYRLISPYMPSRLALIAAVVVAVVIYMAVLLIIRTFSAEEIKILPKGEKIAKTLEKFHLIG